MGLRGNQKENHEFGVSPKKDTPKFVSKFLEHTAKHSDFRLRAGQTGTRRVGVGNKQAGWKE